MGLQHQQRAEGLSGSPLGSMMSPRLAAMLSINPSSVGREMSSFSGAAVGGAVRSPGGFAISARAPAPTTMRSPPSPPSTTRQPLPPLLAQQQHSPFSHSSVRQPPHVAPRVSPQRSDVVDLQAAVTSTRVALQPKSFFPGS